ncbi:MAG: preprotein translocase subunit YajC [Gemmatimonadaceae bacterium]
MNDLFLYAAAALQAQAPAPTPSGGGISMYGFLFQMLAIFGIIYLLLIRPQQKQRKQHDQRLRNLKRGDTIVTAGGIVAEVMHIKESLKEGQPQKSMEDQITIKSAESRLIVERGRIARITTPATPPAQS